MDQAEEDDEHTTYHGSGTEETLQGIFQGYEELGDSLSIICGDRM
jgi:hypothetical protein